MTGKVLVSDQDGKGSHTLWAYFYLMIRLKPLHGLIWLQRLLFSCVCILCFLIYTPKSSITQKYFGTMWDVKNRNFHFSNSQMDWVTVEDPLWRWLLSFCYVLSHPHKYTVKNSLTYSLVNYSTQCHWRTGDKEVPHNPLLTYSQCTILESNLLRFCWLGHPSKTARMSGIIINLETKGWLNIVFTTINTT